MSVRQDTAGHVPSHPPIALTIDFGGLPVRLASDDEAWRRLAARRWRAFTWPDSAPAGALRVVYRVVDPTPTPRALFAARRERLRFDPDDETVLVGAGGVRARRCPEPDIDLQIDGPRDTAPVDRLLQLEWARRRRGLVIHGALLIGDDNRRAWLCTGPSGAGKSTLARLFPGRALCDELVGVRDDGAGLRLESLPFWTGRPGGAPLAGIHLLRHGDHHARRRLTPAKALAALRAQISWPVPDSETVEHVLEMLVRLAREVPVWQLDFRPDCGVWHELTREAA